jgi:hypothetical protein
MDAETWTTNYTAFKLMMAKRGYEKRYTATTVSIYRRNLQRAYIVRMEYLMKEEIKINSV